MKSRFFWTLVATALALPGLMPAHAAEPKLELKDGDRIAIIGGAFVERETNDAFIETTLLTRYPDRHITVRNFGYSGDTVTGEARGLCLGFAHFEEPEKAFERLRKTVTEFKPTVLLLNYGMTESFAGPEKLADFVTDYNKTLDSLIAAAGTSPRIMLLSPTPHEDLGKPLPSPAQHNASLKQYSAAIADIASKRQALYVDLNSLLGASANAGPLTWNGIHFSRYGYWRAGREIDLALGESPRNWDVTINGSSAHSVGASVTSVAATPTSVSFTATDATLPIAAAPGDSPKSVTDGSAKLEGFSRTLHVSGLKEGTYVLKMDGQPIAKASAADWAKGVHIGAGSEEAQVEAVRKLISAKNFDYFNYQRPDNDSYILAFRKREQGKNAVEIPMFLPLVEEKEKQIAALLAPKPANYTLTLEKP